MLAVVDAQTHRLPARLIGPLAIAETITLAAATQTHAELECLLRAGLAASLVAGLWFSVALISPSAMGMGDVYLAGITAALLGWSGWAHVILGQLAVWSLAPIALIALAIARPQDRSLRACVPMGPALIAGTVLTCLL